MDPSVVERSSVPWTILRAGWFLDRLPAIMPVPRGLLLQPMDIGEAPDRLVELARSAPAGRVTNAGGSEVLTSAELARVYLGMARRKKRLVELPVPGKAARALREGAQTCPDQAYGKIRWEEFLHETLHRQRTGTAEKVS